MSMQSKEAFREGVPKELELFELPSTQVAVTDIYFQEIRPLSAVTNDSPIEFQINAQNSLEYVDLQGSQLYVKLKVHKSDASDLAVGEKTGSCNLFLQALFSSTEVTLQNKATYVCNHNPYRAIIQTLLNFGEEAKNSQLSSSLFYKDDNDHPEDPGMFQI